MSWSYDETNLDTTTAAGRLNSVRLLIGDTDTNDQQLQDEEITFALAQNSDNIYFAASWSSRLLANKYSRQVDIDLDGQLSVKYTDLAKNYLKLADNLEYQGKKSGANVGVAAGGISRSEMEANRLNTDRVAPAFRRDQFDNPPEDSSNYYYDPYN